MTPKEKAEELISKSYNVCEKYTTCIQVAILIVDEIISACEYNNVESYNSDWWKKVKHEID